MTRGLLVLLLLVSAQALAQDVAVVTWDHPEQYNDDSPMSLNDIAVTEVEYGPCPPTTALWKTITIKAPTDYAVGIPLPTPGLWCFRARTRDYMYRWSEWTGTVIRESPLPPYTGVLLPPFKLVM